MKSGCVYEGRVESVLYDRFALARTQNLADRLAATNKRLDAALEMVEDLKSRIDK